jgi:hypothetical protein
MVVQFGSRRQAGIEKQRPKMNLPHAKRVRVERKKIVEYLLSASHPDGSSKARFFSRFGFAVARWTMLAEALKKHGRTHPVVSSVESKHGTRYTIDGHLHTSGWTRTESPNYLDVAEELEIAAPHHGLSDLGAYHDQGT